jgi:hypothetical protein
MKEFLSGGPSLRQFLLFSVLRTFIDLQGVHHNHIVVFSH